MNKTDKIKEAQLAYINEDINFALNLLITVVAFGFKFKTFAYIMVVITILQLIYAAIALHKYKELKREVF